MTSLLQETSTSGDELAMPGAGSGLRPALITGGVYLGAALAFTGVGLMSKSGQINWGQFIVLFAVGVALTGAAVVLLARRRANDLSETIEVLSAIAAGDLRRTFDPGAGGQSAQIAAAVNRLVQQLRLSLTMIDHVKDLVQVGARQVYEFGGAMGEASETLAARVNGAASAAAQVSSHVHSVAASTEELAMTIRSVAQHASEASEVASTASNEASAANSSVQELQLASERVEEVVRLITNIAAQTHLLALNATIEAARAGAAGRGFAVVANEVKQLAHETSNATKSVTHSLHEMQGGSAHAAAVMIRVTETINVVSDNQSAIAAAVEEQTTVTQDIGRTVSSVAHGSDDMSASISALGDVARSAAYGGAQARTTAADLALIEELLTDLTKKYSYEPVPLQIETPDTIRHEAITANGITTIQNAVRGTGENQFEYVGRWEHSTGNVESGGTNSYSSAPNDYVTLRFRGRQVRLYCVSADNHGMATISIDGGPQHPVDQYTTTRKAGHLIFQSENLAPGEHKLTLTVTGTNNPQSRYSWVTVDRAEVIA